MQVTRTSDFTALKNALISTKEEIERKNFTEPLSDIDSNFTTARSGFATWSDSVQAALQGYMDGTLQGIVDAIHAEIPVGNLSSLLSAIQACINQCGYTITAKEKYSAAATTWGQEQSRGNTESYWAKKVDGQWVACSSTDSAAELRSRQRQAYYDAQDAYERASADLNDKVKSLNTLLDILTKFKFGEPSPTRSGNETTREDAERAAQERAAQEQENDSATEEAEENGVDPNAIPENAYRIDGFDEYGIRTEDYYASTQTLTTPDGQTREVQVYYDAKTGNRVYFDPSTNKVAMCYMLPNGQIVVQFSTTKPGKAEDKAEGVYQQMRAITNNCGEDASAETLTTNIVGMATGLGENGQTGRWDGDDYADVEATLAIGYAWMHK